MKKFSRSLSTMISIGALASLLTSAAAHAQAPLVMSDQYQIKWGHHFSTAFSRHSWPTFIVGAQVQNLPGASQPITLQLTITDAQSKSGVCPYYLKKLEYEKSPATLNLEIFEETCLNEAFGPSVGVYYWPVPQSLLSDGQSITLFVNKSPVAKLVYTLKNNLFTVQPF